MKKKIVVVGILVLLLCIGVSGCVDEKSKFVGTWETEDGDTTFTFEEDNMVMISGSGPFGMVALIGTFNYTLSDQQITFSSGSFGITLEYSFPESNRLILTNEQGTSLILHKQE